MGPFSFFYVRGILRDNAKLDKLDLIHFFPFFLSLIGVIPYLFSPWSYKLLVADNLMSEHWDTQQFDLNFLVTHKVNQVLNVSVLYFYTLSLWYLIWKYKRKSNNRIYNVPQFKLVRNWLFIFSVIITIITINFTITVADILIYDDKSVFLQKASGPLLFASVFYVIINMVIMFFPHIMYGLPLEILNTTAQAAVHISSDVKKDNFIPQPQPIDAFEPEEVNVDEKELTAQLFSDDYILKIEEQLQGCIEKELFVNAEFRLNSLAVISGIKPHHLSYYFNSYLNSSFSEWRNKLRIDYAIKLLKDSKWRLQTLEALALKSGFSNQTTFIRTFKLNTGKTPSQYVKELMS